MIHRELRSPQTGSFNLLTATDCQLSELAMQNKIDYRIFNLRTPYMNVKFIQFLTKNKFEIRVVVKEDSQPYSEQSPKQNEFAYKARVIPDINYS